jgi:hypothetical protein
MYSLRSLTLAAILVAGMVGDEPAPEWSRKTFAAPPDQVYSAAVKSIAAQHHEVRSQDETTKVVSFHVGTTAWSWGYNMVLKVVTAENNSSNVSIEIARSGGKAVSWGSGRKEVLKIFAGIEKELAKTSPAIR